jgi:hypothetical protein
MADCWILASSRFATDCQKKGFDDAPGLLVAMKRAKQHDDVDRAVCCLTIISCCFGEPRFTEGACTPFVFLVIKTKKLKSITLMYVQSNVNHTG